MGTILTLFSTLSNTNNSPLPKRNTLLRINKKGLSRMIGFCLLVLWCWREQLSLILVHAGVLCLDPQRTYDPYFLSYWRWYAICVVNYLWNSLEAHNLEPKHNLKTQAKIKTLVFKLQMNTMYTVKVQKDETNTEKTIIRLHTKEVEAESVICRRCALVRATSGARGHCSSSHPRCSLVQRLIVESNCTGLIFQDQSDPTSCPS